MVMVKVVVTEDVRREFSQSLDINNDTQVGSNHCQSILHTYVHKDTVDS